MPKLKKILQDQESSEIMLQHWHDNNYDKQLNSYIKHHKNSVQMFKRQNQQIAQQTPKHIKLLADKNHEIAVLKRHMEDIQKHYHNLKEQFGVLKQECDGLLHDNFAMNDKYAMLEQEYDAQLCNVNDLLHKHKSELIALQEYNAEGMLAQLQQEIMDLQAAMRAEVQTNALQLDASKEKYQQELQQLKDAYDADNLEYEQKLLTLAQNHEAQLNELRDELALKQSTHEHEQEQQSSEQNAAAQQKMLLDNEAQRRQLQQQIETLEAKLEEAVQSREIELAELKVHNEELHKRIEDTTSSHMDAEQRWKSELRSVQQTLKEQEQRTATEQALVLELKQRQQMLQDQYTDLQEQKNDLAQELADERGIYVRQKKVAELRDALQHKDQMLAAKTQEMSNLALEKNRTIAELTHRMHRIAVVGVFDKKVQSATVVQKSADNAIELTSDPEQAANEISPTNEYETHSLSPTVQGAVQAAVGHVLNEDTGSSAASPRKRRRARQRKPIYQISEFSDFDESETEWLPQQPKLPRKNVSGSGAGGSSYKDLRRQGPENSDANDAFDQLKQSKV